MADSQPVYGNRQSLGLLAVLDEFHERLDKSEAAFQGLQEQIDLLKITSDGFLEVRARFFGAFERDIVKQIPRGTTTMDVAVREDRRSVHDADIKTDVAVYVKGIREEVDGLFQLVYGVDPSLAVTFSEYLISHPPVSVSMSILLTHTIDPKKNIEAIELLNERATLRSRKETLQLGPLNIQTWDEAWQVYVDELKKSPDEKPSEASITPFAKAYRKYWKVHRRISTLYNSIKATSAAGSTATPSLQDTPLHSRVPSQSATLAPPSPSAARRQPSGSPKSARSS